ncbi:hypothetical protein CLONEX_02434 [[Clostridium] nexile DSM 1787]|nr:hypothetical protein CLONEX_02434 [[Clostridium] nexile DSM 1787]
MIVVEGMGKRNPHQVASRQEPGKGLLCYIAKLALKMTASYISRFTEKMEIRSLYK